MGRLLCGFETNPLGLVENLFLKHSWRSIMYLITICAVGLGHFDLRACQAEAGKGST